MILTLSCPPYVSWEENRVRISLRGVNVSEKISDVGFLYGKPGRHAQPHTNVITVNLHVTLHRIYRFQLPGGGWVDFYLPAASVQASEPNLLTAPGANLPTAPARFSLIFTLTTY